MLTKRYMCNKMYTGGYKRYLVAYVKKNDFELCVVLSPCAIWISYGNIYDMDNEG